MNEDKRSTNIDLLESIAIYFVLLYHSTLYTYDVVQSMSVKNCLLYFSRTILSTCVPLFFFANGYLLFGRNFDHDRHIKKIIKLISLTFVWAFILMPLYLIIEKEPLSFKTVLLNILRLNKKWGMNLFWFIGALVSMYLFFPALRLLFVSDKKAFILFTVACAVLTFGFVLGDQVLAIISFVVDHGLGDLDYPILKMFDPFRGTHGYSFVYFCFGGLVYTYESKIRAIPSIKRNILAITGMVISCLLLFLVGMFNSICWDGKVWDVVWYGYDTVFTFLNVFFIYLLCLDHQHDTRFIRLISQNTLGIYFTHGLIIRLTRPWIMRSPDLCSLPFNIVYAFMILCVCLLLCLLLKRIPLLRKLVE
ncbi:MAG: acyltransferase family protein [Oscillospiraceae bacterium]|nr:acyltransferase family protein [Oscillospiraceae bacterium]